MTCLCEPQVGPRQLLNIKSVTERRENMLWFRVPPKVYFKGGCLEVRERSPILWTTPH